jgi:hypothetical protein
MSAIKTRAKSDGLQLLRSINATQAHGQEGARVDPTRAAHEAGLNLGDVGSERYHQALGYLVEKTALVGNEHTAGSSSSGQPLRTGPSGAEHRTRARTSAGPIAEAYGRFLELPVPVVLVVLWLIGAVLLGTVLVVGYSAAVWLLAISIAR